MIECSLQHVSLDSPPSYCALSYIWEDPTRFWPILVDGVVIRIPTNLGRALKQLHDNSIWYLASGPTESALTVWRKVVRFSKWPQFISVLQKC